MFPMKAMRMAARLSIGGLLLFAAAGCGPNDAITRTTEPSVDYSRGQRAKGGAGTGETAPTRILGGIANQTGEESWFFKLMGTKDAVSRQESSFDAFIASIQFDEKKDKPVTWTLPEGWREGPPKQGRYATILAGPSDDAVELTVITAGGSLLDNVNRWRGQIGLSPIKNEEMGTFCKEVTTKQGAKLTRVDIVNETAAGSQKRAANGGKTPTRMLSGIASQAGEGSWFFKLIGPHDAVSRQEAAFDAFIASLEFDEKKDKPVTWTLPEGWREGPRKQGRYATILVGPAEDPIELTVIPAGGGLLDNVNRWRGQLGLPSVKNEEMSAFCKEVTTKNGTKVTRVDLSGEASKDAQMPPFMRGN